MLVVVVRRRFVIAIGRFLDGLRARRLSRLLRRGLRRRGFALGLRLGLVFALRTLAGRCCVCATTATTTATTTTTTALALCLRATFGRRLPRCFAFARRCFAVRRLGRRWALESSAFVRRLSLLARLARLTRLAAIATALATALT